MFNKEKTNKITNQVLKVLGIVFAIFIIFGIISAITSSNYETNEPTNLTSEDYRKMVPKESKDKLITKLSEKDEMTEAFRKEFMVGCVDQPSDYAYCNCCFESIHENLGNEGLMREIEYYNNTGLFSEGLLDHMVDAVILCYDL